MVLAVQPIAVELLEAVQVEAMLRNGEVIAAALKRSGLHCDNCKFPQNAEEYISLIFPYAEARKAAHRWRSMWYRLDNMGIADVSKPGFGFDRSGWGLVYQKNKAAKELRIAIQAAQAIRQSMQPFRPCPSCRALYNPTSRVSLAPFRMPIHKEFIDD